METLLRMATPEEILSIVEQIDETNRYKVVSTHTDTDKIKCYLVYDQILEHGFFAIDTSDINHPRAFMCNQLVMIPKYV